MPVTTPPSITALPSPPDPNDRATFNARAYPWSVAQQTFATEVGAVASNVAANATDAAASATAADLSEAAAAASATAADLSEAAAAASASSALNAPGTSATSTTSLAVGTGSKTLTIQTGKAYAPGQAVAIADTAAPAANWMWGQITAYNAGTGELTVNTTNAAGAGTLTSWQVSLSANPGTAGASIVRVERTSNTMLEKSNAGNLIDITSGTFTQTFDAAATLGDGWFCYVRNSGTGDITLDPNASETIDGLTSFVMYPGEVRLIQCDGTALRSVVLNSFYRMFTTSGTFTKPPGYAAFTCFVLAGGGGGGAGGAGASDRGGNGGGGGGALVGTYQSAMIALSETITVGAGGAGGATNQASGGTGGDSSFGAVLIAKAGTGGGGGRTFGTSTVGGVGGGVGSSTSPAGFQSSPNTNVYTEYGGATRPAYTADNSSPAPSGSGSMFGGASGGVGQNKNYIAGSGGISRKQSALVGGGGAGALANAGAGQSMTGTFAAGGGGSAGPGGAGGYGCGGGGGGVDNSTNTFFAGGDGGAGLVEIWGVI